MKTAAFDWDGTLVHFNGLRPDYEDPAWILRHTKPHHEGLKRAKNLIHRGTKVHIITGRGQHLRTVTLLQIRMGLDADFPSERLHMSDHAPGQFPGYAALRIQKANTLNRLQPDLFVGDHPECDASASADAGVPFMDAAKFREGYPFPNGHPWTGEPLLGAM